MSIRDYNDDLVPLCERCWIEENSVWEPESVDMEGNILTRLVSVNVPIKLSPGTVCECFICSKVTVVGIYVSADDIEEDSSELGMDMEEENVLPFDEIPPEDNQT